MSQHDDERQKEARDILRRVEGDNVSFLTGSIRQAGASLDAHFAASDSPQHDHVVKWATRLGRALGLIAFAILVTNLFTGWFF